MDSKQVQINTIKRAMGQLTMQLGAKQIWECISEFQDTKADFATFSKSLLSLGVPISQMDDQYYFTSWENWQKIIATINPILQGFNWKRDRFDCDKRAMLFVSLTALLFEINTVRPLYCDVYRVSDGAYAYTHYACIIVDDAGNMYIYDQDNGNGMFGKITGQNAILGNCKYVIKAIK